MPALRCASECGSSSSRGESMPLSVDTRSHLTLSVDCADGAKSNCAWMLRVSRTRNRDPRNELAQTKSATQLIPSAASRFAHENPTGTTNGPGTRWGRLNASQAMAGGRRSTYWGGSTHWGVARSGPGWRVVVRRWLRESWHSPRCGRDHSHSRLRGQIGGRNAVDVTGFIASGMCRNAACWPCLTTSTLPLIFSGEVSG